MKILLATDGTPESSAAVESINKLALSAGDEIKVVCIVDMALPLTVDIYGGFVPDTAELENTAKENARKVVETTAETLKNSTGAKGVVVSSELLFGSPDRRIVESAEDWGADLIIVGSHGYGRWERMLLGSVSDSVIRHAPCSVLVVRNRKEED